MAARDGYARRVERSVTAELCADVQARLAAILLTIMFALFTPLVHIPTLFANPSNHFFWTENAENLALTGAAWVVADSFFQRRH